ncbi:SRPBCC family protein [Billgrantia diversa]|uniref:SRPBCC family protein n=1 Tax=Halomonas sp. MCCC 1A13316 TaxID=2733487 RepID=UPI0018A50C70|nr:SRPBCC family protein [Halomonas sp. MCCC 1A13316]QOR37702.1 SRPBCC family protein [Halomonas sp. MCCC 1A13316]
MDDADYGQSISEDSIRFERLLPGPIERVWAFLTESDKRGLWLAPGTMDTRQGASFTLHFHNIELTPDRTPPSERFRRYDSSFTTHHQVLRYEPPHLLAWTWGGGHEAPSEVTFELSEAGDQVRLVVTHRRLADDDTRVTVASGWHTHLTIFVDVLQGHRPAPFWPTFEYLEAKYRCRITSPRN